MKPAAGYWWQCCKEVEGEEALVRVHPRHLVP